jgi:glycosyltransferase involved in cell wall biosynthesis
MRIAILYRTIEDPWGGGNSFLRSLRKAWIAQGVGVLDRLEGGLDGVLVNSSYLGPGRLLEAKVAQRLVQRGYASAVLAFLGLSRWQRFNTRPPFVHRLDGIFKYYGRAANDPADAAQLQINCYMDWTIYQSGYCQQSFAAEGVDVSRSVVIHNGVDLERFFPAARSVKMGTLRLVAVSWSPNLRKGFPETVRASQLPGVEVTFIGNWNQSLDAGDVRVIPPVSHAELPGLLRQHHALLHMARNDPCSNTILEGMACGLPVIYHPSGGSPEIVKECGIPGESDLATAVEELRDRYTDLREKALTRQPELSINHAAGEYLRVFQRLGAIPLSQIL